MTQTPDPDRPDEQAPPPPQPPTDQPPTDPAPTDQPPTDPEPPHGDPLTGHGGHYAPPGYGQGYPPQPGYGQGYPPQPGYGPGYPQPSYGQPAYGGYQPNYNPYAGNAAAPYGYDPKSGLPFSEKSKLVAGLLQVLLPLGIGRMYMGQTGMGVAQLLVTLFTCGMGAIWPFVDGIIILVGDQRDADGLPLRT